MARNIFCYRAGNRTRHARQNNLSKGAARITENTDAGAAQRAACLWARTGYAGMAPHLGWNIFMARYNARRLGRAERVTAWRQRQASSGKRLSLRSCLCNLTQRGSINNGQQRLSSAPLAYPLFNQQVAAAWRRRRKRYQ